MSRRRPSLDAWRAWRRRHFGDGAARDEDEISPLLDMLLATKRGAIAVLREDRRQAKAARAQHTPPAIKDADYLHAAYGRRHGRR